MPGSSSQRAVEPELDTRSAPVYRPDAGTSGYSGSPSGSPTRLTAATGLVRPTLTLPHLQLGRDSQQQQQSNRPLKLPVAKPLADATPFHRQFTSPRVKNPYADDDPHEIRAASSAPSLVDTIIAATDGVLARSSFTITTANSSSKYVVAGEPFPAPHEHSEPMSTALAIAKETLDDLVSNDVDEHSEVYSHESKQLESERSLSGPDDLSVWSALTQRFATFITNVGFVGESEAVSALNVAAAAASDDRAKTSGQEGGLRDDGSSSAPISASDGRTDLAGGKLASTPTPRGVVVAPCDLADE